MSASSRATDKQVVCEHCWDKGWKKRARSHTKERCFDLHPELRPQRQAGPTHYSAEFVTVLDDNTATHLAAAAIVQEGQSTLWHVDSGASAHLCNTAEWFAELHPCPPKVVMVANKNVVRCTQQGTIHLRVSTGARTGCKWEDAILQSVLYVPDLGVNLLSVQANGQGRASVRLQHSGVRHHQPQQARRRIRQGAKQPVLARSKATAAGKQGRDWRPLSTAQRGLFTHAI